MKQYKFGNDTRTAIVDVASLIGDKLGKTLGPAGRNYFLPSGITNDGRTIVSQIEFTEDGKSDEVKNSISAAFEEVALRQDKDAGDGTTTSIVLATKLAESIMPKISDIDIPTPGDRPVMEISKQLDDETKQVIELLEKNVKKVETLEDLKKVASTSMEGHEAHNLVAETIWEAGKDSNTAIKEGFNGKVEKDVQPGIQYPLSIESPFMFTNARNEAIHNDVPVIVANHIFESYSEITKFLATRPQEDAPKGIVIVARKFSVPFVSKIADIKRSTNFPILLLSANLTNGEFEDIAAFCDAQLMDTHPKEGKNIKDLTWTDAGFVKQIVAGREQTSFIGGRGVDAIVPVNGSEHTTRVQARVDVLKGFAEKETDKDKRELFERRAAGLLGGIATIYVDAKTAVDRYYLKLKIEDGMNSCKNALDGGVVRGGGLALEEIAEQMKDSLLYDMLKEPAYRIRMNAGGRLEVGEDVVDAFNSVKTGIENAVAVVKILVTTEGIIADVEEDLVDKLQKKLTE